MAAYYRSQYKLTNMIKDKKKEIKLKRLANLGISPKMKTEEEKQHKVLSSLKGKDEFFTV